MPDDISILLAEFRTSRREFETRVRRLPFEAQLTVPAGETWNTRDLVMHIAAWLDEANDRIPRILAGAPSVRYDLDAFNAEAVARASAWTPQQTFGAFRRAADRYETMIGEMDAAELVEHDDAMRWLRNVAGRLMNEHFDDLDRLAALVAPRSIDTEASQS